MSAQPLPAGWRWVKLGDVCDFLDSRRIPINDTERKKRISGKVQDSLYPYYGANGQVGWIDDFLFDEPLILLAEDGGFFGSKDKPIAYAVRGKYWVNNHAHVLKPRSEIIDFDYCFHAISIRPDVGELVAGTTRAKLNQETARSIEVLLPPPDEQKRIAAALNAQMDSVAQARRAAEEQLRAAKELPSAYLREVFDDEIAHKYPMKTLDDVCRDISDGTHFTPMYIPKGIAFLSVKDVKEIGISFDSCRYISDEEHRKLIKRCKPEYGDVLYTKVGTTGIAKAVDVNREFSIFVSVALLKLKQGIILPEYLERVLNSPFCRVQAEDLTQGMANRNLVLKDLKRIKLPLPPIDEQLKVISFLAEKLSSAQVLRKSLEAQLAEIRQLPSALLRRAFAGEI